MPRKPQENRTVTISWENYKYLTDRAIGNDTNIKTLLDKAVEEYLRGEGESSPSSEKVYACPECGKEFDEKKELQGHMLGAHNKGLGEKEIDYELKNA